MSGTDFHRIPIGPGEMAAFTPFPTKIGVAEEGKCLKKLHQIAAIRRNQNISIVSCAKKLGISIEEARMQEHPTSDLTLTQLLAWKEVLDVPLSELLGQSDEDLENPVRNRALMIKVMKTAKQILQTARESRIHYMGETLIDQLVELMPELAEVSAWPDVGQSHENRNAGVAATRRFDPDIARQLER